MATVEAEDPEAEDPALVWKSFLHWSEGNGKNMDLFVDSRIRFNGGNPHGKWNENNGDIHITWHYLGDEKNAKDHVYKKIESCIAWELTSVNGWPNRKSNQCLLLPKHE